MKIKFLVFALFLTVIFLQGSLVNASNAITDSVIFSHNDIKNVEDITQTGIMMSGNLSKINESAINNMGINSNGINNMKINDNAINNMSYRAMELTQIQSIVEKSDEPTPPDYDSAFYDSGWDGSIGVRASSTIYWT